MCENEDYYPAKLAKARARNPGAAVREIVIKIPDSVIADAFKPVVIEAGDIEVK